MTIPVTSVAKVEAGLSPQAGYRARLAELTAQAKELDVRQALAKEIYEHQCRLETRQAQKKAYPKDVRVDLLYKLDSLKLLRALMKYWGMNWFEVCESADARIGRFYVVGPQPLDGMVEWSHSMESGCDWLPIPVKHGENHMVLLGCVGANTPILASFANNYLAQKFLNEGNYAENSAEMVLGAKLSIVEWETLVQAAEYLGLQGETAFWRNMSFTNEKLGENKAALYIRSWAEQHKVPLGVELAGILAGVKRFVLKHKLIIFTLVCLLLLLIAQGMGLFGYPGLPLVRHLVHAPLPKGYVPPVNPPVIPPVNVTG